MVDSTSTPRLGFRGSCGRDSRAGIGAASGPITLFVILLSLATPARAGEMEDDPAYRLALGAFQDGRLDEAERSFGALAARYPERAEPRFWQAYSAHKRGDLAGAERAVRDALQLDPDSVDALYLAGLLAHRRGDLSAAEATFERVKSLDLEGDLGVSAAEHLVTVRYLRQRDEAIRQVMDGDLDRAAAVLEELAQQRPGDTTVLYYRGYLAYRQGDVADALTYLDAVLQVRADDPWARFMRALALASLDRTDEAAREMTLLATAGDADVSREATAALERWSVAGNRLEERPGPGVTELRTDRAPPRAGSWRFGGGIAVDSNPAYVTESSYVSSVEAAVAVAAHLRGDVPLLRRGGTTLYVGPRGLIRAYPDGPTEYDLAQITARVELNQRGRRLSGWVGGGGGISFLGWRLFLDVEEVYLGGTWRQARWTESRLTGLGYRRGSHLDDYQNLDAWGARGTLAQRFQPHTAFRLEVGYTLQGEQARGYEVSWDGLTGEPDPNAYVATLTADATYRGHGPLASLTVSPPWQDLRLRVSGALQWRFYREPERVLYEVDGATTAWEGDRRDRRLTLTADVSLRTVWKLHVYVRYGAVLNFSSLTGELSPVDRNYQRHLVSSGLEVRL